MTEQTDPLAVAEQALRRMIETAEYAIVQLDEIEPGDDPRAADLATVVRTIRAGAVEALGDSTAEALSTPAERELSDLRRTVRALGEALVLATIDDGHHDEVQEALARIER